MVRRATSRGKATARRFSRRAERKLRLLTLGLGRGVECPFCGWTGSEFLPAGRPRRPNRLCPKCGSLERYRALYLFLTRYLQVGTRPVRMLEVAPDRAMQAFCGRLPDLSYVSLDLNSPLASVRCDLSRSCFKTGSFELILCSHVLEHILDDRTAVAEIYRMLHPTGCAVVIVPMVDGDTFEDPNARPEDYERLYGQSDHVRIYGADDFRRRLKEAGFGVEEFSVPEELGGEDDRQYAAMGQDEIIFICRP